MNNELLSFCRFVQKCMKVKKKDDQEDIFINPSLVTAVLLIANFGLFIVDRILCRPLSLQDTGWEESDDEALFLSTSCVPKLFPQLLLSPSPATHLGMGLAQLHEILKRKTTTYTASF